MINRFVITLLLLVLHSLVGLAHSPLLSTVAVTKSKDNTWSLHISASLSAFQFELKNRYPALQIDSLTGDDFQRLVLQHLKETVTIGANSNDAIELKNGMIKLGHQTDIRFEIVGMPAQLQQLEVRHLGFGTLTGHYCVFTMVMPETGRTNFILQQDNQFTVDLAVDNTAIVETKPEKAIKGWFPMLLVLMCVLFLLGIWYARKPQLA
ncbi:hypothetical protein [Fibrella aquatica]|uniref:hypothetical protein n=1 Tax=Fibrella aquatica TaxID=3242487 RepID=UPI0035228D88